MQSGLGNVLYQLYTRYGSILLLNIIVLAYLLPLILLGENAYVGIHDQLDSHIIWYRILKQNGMVFSDSYQSVSQMMDAPRLSFYNEFFLNYWLHYLLGTFPALVLNKFILHFSALWGMYLLLKHFKINRKVIFLSSIYFALLPHSQFWGLSIAAQPLVLLIFLKIYERNGLRLSEIFVLLIYLLYTNFYSVSLFFLLAVSAYFLVDFVKKQKFNWTITLTILVMAVLSLVMEYRLIESIFFNDTYLSSRLERDPYHQRPDLKKFFKFLLIGHYHAQAFQFLALLVGGYYLVRYRYLGIRKLATTHWYLISLFIYIVVINALPLIPALSGVLKDIGISAFSFQRFYTLLPLFTAIVLAFCIDEIRPAKVLKDYFLTFFIGVITLSLFLLNPTILAKTPLAKHIGEPYKLSFAEFFDEALFDEIKAELSVDPSRNKVASLGLHPAIAHFNGFHTLDGYLTNYPLLYKHRFRKLIAAELNKNEIIADYYDKWGSRCYLMANELGNDYMYVKERAAKVSSFELNCLEFVQMGGRFLFSAVPIEQFQCEEFVNYRGAFEGKRWRIHIYEFTIG